MSTSQLPSLTLQPRAVHVLRLIRLWAVVLGFSLAAGCASTVDYDPLPPNGLRPVIAIARFDNQSGYQGQWAIGNGMADLLTDELVRSDRFTVVERQELDQIAREIELQDSTYFRDEGRVDRGRLLNARFLIRGRITDFSQVRGYGVDAIWRWFRFLGRASVARVALALSIVNVETGAVIGSVVSTGDAPAREVSVDASYRGIAFGGDVWWRTPIGRATRRAIDDALSRLVDSVPVETWHPTIASIEEDGTIIVSGGRNRGVAIGQKYGVRGPSSVVTDPLTGDVLEVRSGELLAELEIIDSRAGTAVGRVTRGEGALVRGCRLVRTQY